jgi:RHS repeat-associated protein
LYIKKYYEYNLASGSIKYLPFGGTRSSQGTLGTDKLFTGQRLDNTGLYYYGARYYDPTIGRFISADTIVQNPYDPQTLNRYSYCLNNPLRYVDPTGHLTMEEYYAGMTMYGIAPEAVNLVPVTTSTSTISDTYQYSAGMTQYGVAPSTNPIDANSASYPSISNSTQLVLPPTITGGTQSSLPATNQPVIITSPDPLPSMSSDSIIQLQTNGDKKDQDTINWASLGLDIVTVGADVVSMIPEPHCVVIGYGISNFSGLAGGNYSYQRYQRGELDSTDMWVSIITTGTGIAPWAGVIPGAFQLLYDIPAIGKPINNWLSNLDPFKQLPTIGR